MNILYIAFKDFSQLHYGASKKVISECRAFENYGHNVTLIGRENNSTVIVSTDGSRRIIKSHKRYPIGKLQTVQDKNNQIKDILKYIKNRKYDYCYIRYDLCTFNFIKMLKAIKNVCSYVDIEIPTYPYDKEYAGKINRLRLAVDSFFGRQLYKYVNRIITFYAISGGKFNNVPVLLVPNGFDFDEIEIIKDDTVPKDIHIAAVSSMRHWHGYERMISGLNEYYQSGGTRKLFLHLVGNGREYNKYAELVTKYKLQENVIFHGALHGEELDNLLEMCTLGIDSLARHRTGISVLSSLKSREYGAKGLPFINSCDIDIVENDFKYFLKVPAEESSIDINTIVDFYDLCYKDGSRLSVAKEVRRYIENKSNMQAIISIILKNIIKED